ncbi:SRPBCC domain-containing protein [Pseudoclavibacter sp. AY1F1]|uniref:SRPBCC family protein n=1 Tax=Pseudoclavibacter sp. AY1F1 TaxID=2080583 RepID=UPI000CE7C918|nr:SRPBCC domain-containing protein [Pseudoclavibacter sp. AY1F1]PPF44764.1 SRPBCC domain-containing protein [Pseudoclavibacter sp. AY1F1]
MTSPETAAQPEFTLRRNVTAPRDRVWRAWTDPAELTHWHHPAKVSTPLDTIVLDVRESGAYHYTMVNDENGDEYPTAGTYLLVDEGKRLVFTWGLPEDDPAESPVVSVDLAPSGDATEVILHVRGIAGEPGDDNVYDGWTEALENLAAHLEP